MSHRPNPRKYKGVTRHEKPLPSSPAPARPRDSHDRTRRILSALHSGYKLVQRGRRAMVFVDAGGKIVLRVKERLFRCLADPAGLALVRIEAFVYGAWHCALTAAGAAALCALGVVTQ